MVFIVAESGVNHNGDINRAHKLLADAAQTGADAIKFQLFDPERLDPPGSHRQMLERLKLPRSALPALAGRAHKEGLEFMCSAFDVDSLKYLVEEIGIKRIKIASGQTDNAELMSAAIASGLPIIISTGMMTVQAVRTMMYEYFSGDGRNVTLLHCVSSYPCPDEEANIKGGIGDLKGFMLPVGYSDHTLGIAGPLAAVALGVCMIEKHFTLNWRDLGPDHATSLEKHEFTAMVSNIRRLEKMLGGFPKTIMGCESEAIKIANRRRFWRVQWKASQSLEPAGTLSR